MKITVNDKNGQIKASLEGEDHVVLAWKGQYEDGDSILFQVDEANRFYVIRVDDTMDEAIVFLTETEICYKIPWNEGKNSYNPNSFFGERHYVTLRRAQEYESKAYRNLAKNVMDQHDDVGCYPHVWANVETRGEAAFAARNVIDGVVANLSHGKWPYESWGINQRDDAQITVEFGRKVDFDHVVLYTRADFPHDNWWVQVTISCSDGTSQTFDLEKSAAPHRLDMERKGIEWIRLEKLIKADDPSPFPALTQIEVYGSPC